MAKSAINASGAMLLPSSVQVSESISGSVVPMAMFEENMSARMFESIGEFSPEELNRTIWEYEGTGRFSLEERRDALPWLFVDFYQTSEEKGEDGPFLH